MKKTLLTMACHVAITGMVLFHSDTALSQETVKKQNSNWSIGVTGGGNLSKLNSGSREINNNYDYGIGYSAGVLVSYRFYKYLSLVGEPSFTEMSSVSKGIQPLLPTSPLQSTTYQRYANFKKTERFDYIEVPIMVRITTGNRIKYYANAGPYIGIALNVKMETSGRSLLYTDREGVYTEPINGSFHSVDENYSNTKNINSLNFGATVGVGTGYTMGKHAVWLDFRYNAGLVNIRSNTSVNGENKLQSGSIKVAYTYTIPK